MLYSKIDKTNMAKSSVKNQGFNLALTDKGVPVRYTYFENEPKHIKSYLNQYPDMVETPVSALRVVQHGDGKDAYTEKWGNWGYRPG
ncbi:MAG: hypothetical protein K9G62_04265 [Alphaproteobacteria bacterium]|nr:hypothetical protein [Alphaproteobacteria bacterium]